MDIASFLGIVLGLLAIGAGMVLEGGSLKQIMQPTAALIVVGGTLGAVLLQFPLRAIGQATAGGVRVFFSTGQKSETALKLIVAFAYHARKDGILSLDARLSQVKDPFLLRALMLAVDGTEPGEIRTVMRLELENRADMEEAIPAVFEAAGGYAPTVGILGAVLGLIQVMQHLDHIDEVGRGIAVAFVATIYGVGLANIICLPVAGKLRLMERDLLRHQEMMIDGVTSILEGLTPSMIETRLRTYLPARKSSQGKDASRRERPFEQTRAEGHDEVAA